MTKTTMKETIYDLTPDELEMAVLAYMERDASAKEDIDLGEVSVDIQVQTCAYDSGTGRPKVKIKGAKVTIRREE